MSPSSFIDVEELYKKDKELKREDIKLLQEWARKESHLPQISELQLILFLHSCYYSNEVAKKCIETYYTVRTHCPEFFCDRNFAAYRSKILDVVLSAPLSKLTPRGDKIIFGKLLDTNADRFSVPFMVKNFDMSTLLMLRQEGPQNGEIFVLDFKGFSFAHLGKISLSHVKKFFIYFQEAMPIRVLGIHVINVSPVVDKLLIFIKPFMKQELYNLIQLHPGNYETLYKSVPKECLPRDYGGTVESTSELKEKWNSLLLTHAEYFAEEEKIGVDESKRIGKPKDANEVFGIEGTFKKLDID